MTELKIWDYGKLSLVDYQVIRDNLDEFPKVKKVFGFLKTDNSTILEHRWMGSTPPLNLTNPFLTSRQIYGLITGEEVSIDEINQKRETSIETWPLYETTRIITKEQILENGLSKVMPIMIKIPLVNENGLEGSYQLVKLRKNNDKIITEGHLFEKYSGIISNLDLIKLLRNYYSNWPEILEGINS